MSSGAGAGQVRAAAQTGRLPGAVGESGVRAGARRAGAAGAGPEAEPEFERGGEREEQTEA